MTPEPVSSERLDMLVEGGQPEGIAERELVALMTDLRDSAGAPPDLRDRIQAAVRAAETRRPSPLGRLAASLRGMSPGRLAMVAAPACVLALMIAVAGVWVSGAGLDSSPTSDDRVAARAPAAGEEDAGRMPRERALSEVVPRSSVAPGGAPATTAGATPVPPGSIPPTGDPSRRQDVRATTVVRVDDVSDLSRAGAAAMRRVQTLGGFTANANYDVPSGERGQAVFTFRVPIARAQDALAAFADLGTVTAQSATIADLAPRLDEASRRIAQIQDEIQDLRAELRRTPTNQAIRARIRALRDEMRTLIASSEQVRAGARLATLDLTLTTEGPPEPAPAAPGRFEDAASDGLGALSVTFAAILRVGLVLLPFLVIAIGGLYAWRVVRRRGDRRLLEAD